MPTMEQINLLLHREEASDLLKERFEIRLAQGSGFGVKHRLWIQSTAILHQLNQKSDALLMGVELTEIPT